LYKIKITNNYGRVFFQETFNNPQIVVDLSDFPVGDYNVYINAGNQKTNLCLMKNLNL